MDGNQTTVVPISTSAPSIRFLPERRSCRPNAWPCRCQLRACVRRGRTSRSLTGSRDPNDGVRGVSQAISGGRNLGNDRSLWYESRARNVLGGGILDATTAAGLVESSMTFSERHTVFGRGEVGGMPAHHLHAHEYSTSVFAIGKVQIGYVRHLRATRGLQPGIGGTVSISLVPPALAPRYSGRTAPSFGVFFSLQAARHQM